MTDEIRSDDAQARSRAQFILGLFAGAVLLCLGVATSRDPNPRLVPPSGQATDLDVYQRIVERVRGGDLYYDAAHQELRAGGYPTRSVFNWRTPCYAWLLGRVTGDEAARLALMIGVLAGVVMACRDLIDDGGIVAGSIGGVFLVGATGWCLGRESVLCTELWGAMLILLSFGARRRGRMAVAVVLGVAAVFYRELALPYAAVSLGFAARNGRRREALGWGLGLALFAAFLAWHASAVHARLTPADQAFPGGWVRFGGVRFLLNTAQTNVFLMPLPLWVTGLYLPLACLGLAAMPGESGQRAGVTGAVFLAAFAVVGNPFNFYWGFIDAPLLALGIAHAPGALLTLARAAFPGAGRLAVAPARP